MSVEAFFFFFNKNIFPLEASAIDYHLYLTGQTKPHDHPSARGFGEASIFNWAYCPPGKTRVVLFRGEKGEGSMDREKARIHKDS